MTTFVLLILAGSIMGALATNIGSISLASASVAICAMMGSQIAFGLGKFPQVIALVIVLQISYLLIGITANT